MTSVPRVPEGIQTERSRGEAASFELQTGPGVSLDGSGLDTVHAFSRPDPSGGGAGCQAHSWVYAGRWHTPTPRCEDPQRMECAHCGEASLSLCKSTRRSRCVPCSERHRKTLAWIGVSGRASDGLSSEFFVTLTAPGADVLPWDRERCSHGPGVACSGELGCVVDWVAAAAWHADVSERLSHFVEYVRRDVERYLRMVDATGPDRMQYFGSWEMQRREMLHRHMAVRCPGKVPQRIMRRIVKAHAVRWGFGPQVKCDALREGSVREMWYVAKYATKSADDLSEMTLLDLETGELRHGTRKRPWSASWHWGETVSSMRKARQAYAASRAGDRPAGVPAAAGRSPALDPQRERSTLTSPEEWGVLDLMRRELGAVLL